MGEPGILLNTAHLASLVPEGARIEPADTTMGWRPLLQGVERCAAGSILTHVGGRPVAEVVAEIDQERADAGRLRSFATTLGFMGALMGHIADRMDERAANRLHPDLLRAWHDRRDTEGVDRG